MLVINLTILIQVQDIMRNNLAFNSECISDINNILAKYILQHALHNFRITTSETFILIVPHSNKQNHCKYHK